MVLSISGKTTSFLRLIAVLYPSLPTSSPIRHCIPCSRPVVGVLSIIVDLAPCAASLGTDVVMGALARLHVASALFIFVDLVIADALFIIVVNLLRAYNSASLTM